MMRLAAVVAAAILLASACGSDRSAPEPSASAAPGSSVTLHAYNVELEPPAEEGSDQLAFIVHARGPLHVVVRGPDLDICPVPPAEGETPPCEHRKVADIEGEGVIFRATKEDAPAMGPVQVDEISITYDPADHTARLELPTIPPRPGESVCKDACNPVFELTPFRSGILKATATWKGFGEAKLLVETGGMSEDAYTELGKPYEEIAAAEGSSDQERQLTVTATVPASETAVALQNMAGRPLLGPAIDVAWP